MRLGERLAVVHALVRDAAREHPRRDILSRTWVSRLDQISDLRERYFRSLETLFLISN